MSKPHPSSQLQLSGPELSAPASSTSNTRLLVTSHQSADEKTATAAGEEKETEPKSGGDEISASPAPATGAAPSGPRVKLTRKCPYVVGPHISSSILKGTPKPVITRKPPLLLKDKPKIPLKPNNLLLRSPSPHSLSSCSSSPSPTPSEHEQLAPPSRPTTICEGAAVAATTVTSNKRSASLVRGRNPVAAPRTFSFRLNSEPATLRKE